MAKRLTDPELDPEHALVVRELERREHQIERARELAEIARRSPTHWTQALEDLLAILSENASDANETQDSEGSA